MTATPLYTGAETALTMPSTTIKSAAIQVPDLASMPLEVLAALHRAVRDAGNAFANIGWYERDGSSSRHFLLGFSDAFVTLENLIVDEMAGRAPDGFVEQNLRLRVLLHDLMVCTDATTLRDDVSALFAVVEGA